MSEKITQLEIKGKEFEAGGTFAFARKAKEFTEKDKDGNEQGGLTKIYNGLLQRKVDSIVDFWVCSTASDKSIKREHVEAAIEQVIGEKEDTIELLQGALDVLDNSGFFKQEIEGFWYNVHQGYRAADKEDREKMKNSAQLLKGMHQTVVTGEAPPEEETTA